MRIIEDIGQNEDSIREQLENMNFHRFMMERMRMERLGDDDDEDLDGDPHGMMYPRQRRD